MVRLTRRVTFSAGHRYWVESLTPEANRARYGPWASPYNHGHNYVLDVTVAGEVDSADGMVVNIKRVDDLLKERVLAPFDGRSINDEVPAFRERSPTLENLLLHFRDALLGGKDPLFDVPRYEDGRGGEARVHLDHLRLQESPTLWADLGLAPDAMTLTRSYEFAASHRLHAPSLSDEENGRLYGKCNRPHGHGHNYVLEVTVGGAPDPATGMLVDLGALDEAVEREVVDRYDHRNLDVDVPELSGRVTTSEVVAQAIFDRLNGRLPAQLERVRLWETARNAFDVVR